MPRIAILTVAVLSALALGATPALADPPEVPYGDFDAEDWSAVTVSDESHQICENADCDFYAQTNGPWAWRSYPDHHIEESYWCSYGDLDGLVTGSGIMFIGSATLGLTSGQFFCNYWETTALPWIGSLCMHNGTGEVWNRQSLALKERWYPHGNVMSGISFGKFEEYALGKWRLVFDDADSGMGGEPGMWGDHRHTATFEISRTLDIEMDDGPCTWGELES